MIRAVIDTNVLVSAMISSGGNEALLVMAINQGMFVPCYSAEILEEYSEVLLRPKFDFLPQGVSALIGMFRHRGRDFHPATVSRMSPDPEDDKFIACALAAKADFLITGNKRHFPENVSGTKIVNAGELLEFITLQL